MKSLCLLRHAKSDWQDPAVADIDRPLASRGELAAPRMGRYMRELHLAPDLVLCSPARRARQTLDLVVAQFEPQPAVRIDPELYMASPAKLLQAVRQVTGEPGRLLIIGHNPGLASFAIRLAGSGDPVALRHLQQKYPTAALAEFGFDVAGWSDASFAAGRLERFVAPRDLD